MFFWFRLVALSLGFHFSIALYNDSFGDSDGINPIVDHNAVVNQNYTASINETTQYIYEFKIPRTLSNDSRPARVTVVCTDAKSAHPLFVILRQAKGVLSWQLPLMVPTQQNVVEYHRTSRTLCPNTNYRDVNLMLSENRNSRSYLLHSPPYEEVIINIQTSSPENITFSLNLEIVEDFIVSASETRTLVPISPSEPKYYQFAWSQAENASKSVVLRVDSTDKVCMVVSIQNISCPVFDLERTVQFEGYRQTVTTRGGITLTRDLFPDGFYIVLVVKGDDFDCTGEIYNVSMRSKNVTLSFQPSISYMEYLRATIAAFFFYASFYVVSVFLCLAYYLKNRNSPDFINDLVTAASVQGESDRISVIHQGSLFSRTGGSLASSSGNDSLQSNEPELLDTLTDEEIASYDHLNDASTDKDVILSKRHLYVCDLARKNPKSLQRKSMLYVGSLLTVATFYVLPVVQLVLSSQKVLQQTGNQDLCYYNFLCSYPLGYLSDFNHVFSNAGYILLGLLFILLVYRRDKMYANAVGTRTDLERYGIPQHYGLLYAMGAALMMEGVLSGCYHVCPNHSNFQFDTSFMYTIALLCMLKIYHTRHPDINASANATFGVLAVVILVGMAGILAGTKGFWAAFSVLHLLTCLWLSGEIYYMGRLRFGFSMVQLAWNLVFREIIPNPGAFFKPRYRSRLVLLVLGNMFNWALVATVWIYHLDNSFGTYLLAVFMANLMLYTIFYIIMKLLCKERILAQPLAYLILATVGWGASLNFFLRKSTSWAVTPAQSRAFNQPCLVLDFYDRHDVWHFLSAISMFFSFMLPSVWNEYCARKYMGVGHLSLSKL